MSFWLKIKYKKKLKTVVQIGFRPYNNFEKVEGKNNIIRTSEEGIINILKNQNRCFACQYKKKVTRCSALTFHTILSARSTAHFEMSTQLSRELTLTLINSNIMEP